jgi:hypothetical protein
MGKAKLNEGEMPEALAAKPKGGGKARGTSQAKRRQTGAGVQHIRRRRRLETLLAGLERKMFRMEDQGRSTAGIRRAIEQTQYAIARPHVIQPGSGGKPGRGGGKKAPLEFPETFAPPHTPPHGFWAKHQHVHGQLARTLNVPEGAIVTKTLIRDHFKAKAAPTEN